MTSFYEKAIEDEVLAPFFIDEISDRKHKHIKYNVPKSFWTEYQLQIQWFRNFMVVPIFHEGCHEISEWFRNFMAFLP